MKYKNQFEGSCHCGNIIFDFYTNKSAIELKPRTCQCSMCQRHGASYISDPQGKLEIVYKKQEDVNNHRAASPLFTFPHNFKH